ncbi:MAG: hypothetical protein KDA17_07065 [Candidatus Saccharibacteria bacterium]|nr:hypothetical protein [Candidatus Saccharibacteria bacterium]
MIEPDDLAKARAYITLEQFDQARRLLKQSSHPKAKEYIMRLNRYEKKRKAAHQEPGEKANSLEIWISTAIRLLVAFLVIGLVAADDILPERFSLTVLFIALALLLLFWLFKRGQVN